MFNVVFRVFIDLESYYLLITYTSRSKQIHHNNIRNSCVLIRITITRIT